MNRNDFYKQELLLFIDNIQQKLDEIENNILNVYDFSTYVNYSPSLPKEIISIEMTPDLSHNRREIETDLLRLEMFLNSISRANILRRNSLK